MRPWTILLTTAAFCIGCTHITLERRTINQASTLSDLQYRQVLDNLAMFLCNRGSLPWHLRLAAGTVQVADQGFVSVLANTIHKAQVNPTVSAQRTGVGQWDVDPAVDADDLELLQLAYQKAVNPTDLTIDRRIDEAICELCIRFDLLPNKNALLRLFIAEEAEAKIQETLSAVCSELDELNKLEKGEKPTAIAKRIEKIEKRIQEINKTIGPGQPNCERDQLKMEQGRLEQIVNCIRQGEDALDTLFYYVNVRRGLVKRKLDLVRAWNLIESILRPIRGEPPIAAAHARGFAAPFSLDGFESFNPSALSAVPSLAPQPQPALGKYLVLLVMHLICDPGYTPPAADPEATRRNVGLIAQAEDKVQKLEQLIENTKFTTPWFHCGKLKDVPKCACYVGHYCNCGCDLYVWVMAEQLEVLKDFVLVVLGLAPIEKQDILSGYPTGRGTAFSPAFTGVAH